jgi:hypothetical protein
MSVKNLSVSSELADKDNINLRRGEFRFAFSETDENKNGNDFGNSPTYVEDCLILGNDLNYSICSDSSGNLVIYQNQRSLEDNCGVYSLGHSSKIQDMKLSVLKTHLITIGLDDRICIEWDLSTHHSGGKQRNGFQRQGLGMLLQFDEYKLVKRESDFCKRTDMDYSICSDSFTLFRGFNNKKLNYLAHDESSNLEENSFLMKRIPEISIKLNHVYGIECFHRRDTLFYLHFYNLHD